MRTLLLALAAATGLAASAVADDGATTASIWPAVRSPYAGDAAVEARVEAILGRMSLEEKVGQIVMAEIKSISPEDVRRYHIGGVLNGGGSFPTADRNSPIEAWVAAANAFYDASMDERDGRVGVPVLWGTDAVHGHNNVVGATLFPHNIGLGAMNDPALMRDIGVATAREVAATGLYWTFAPTVAVARDDRWGRTYESYSESPDLVAAYATEFVVGLQGHPALGDSFGPGKVIATAKHFIGDGGTEGGDDQGDTRVDEATLKRLHGTGHITAIGAGAQTVMATFNSWNGVKTHGNRHLLTDVLKDAIGFDGFVVGDWNGHEQVPGCSVESCPAAINAGVDMIMVPTAWKAFLRTTIRQVRKGEIPEARLDDAVRRILRVKVRAGLFEKGRPSTQPLAGRRDVIGHPDHRLLARRAVAKSLVLLKNDNVLPLRPTARILVAGEGADSIPMQTGGWSVTWQGTDTTNADFPGATSILAGVRETVEAAGGRVIHSASGSYDEKPDAAIVVFGETPYAEFEGDLPDGVDFADEGPLKLLKKLAADGVPTVAVFLSGRPRYVTPEIEAAGAFVAAWLPGTEGGGVADVLFTDETGAVRQDFTGRLSFSWPAAPDQQPVNVGDADYAPLFPFGYGLDYAGAARKR